MNKKVIAKAKKIKLLLMDVDGVLTDGKMYFFPNRNGRVYECKAFSALDGIGLRLLAFFKIKTGMITGRESLSSSERAKAMLMTCSYQGYLSKTEPFEEILKGLKLKPENVAYMGDDLTDIPVLKKVGFACAPKNALEEVKKVSHFITKKEGGNGAVREVCDLLLKSQGQWKQVMKCANSAYWPDKARQNTKIILYSQKRRA